MELALALMAAAVHLSCLAAGIEATQPASELASAAGLLVYVGTYTKGESEGIYAFRLDPASGALSPAGLAARSDQPSFLALHPGRRHLYAVNEVEEMNGEKTGSVSAFEIDAATGRLGFLNRQPSGGGAPCHLVVDPTGRFVLVANYAGGSVAVLPIEEGGRLGAPTHVAQHAGSSAHPERQTGPHAHWVGLDPEDRFVLASDLGLDKVMVYRLDRDAGRLAANDPAAADLPPGAGPRHVAFHRTPSVAYVITELRSGVTVFSWDAGRGLLRELQAVPTLPGDFTGENTTAEVAVHPSGRFLYGSNRGHDSLAVFRVDASTGRLAPAGHAPTRGKAPRHFAIDPSGQWLIAANQESDSLTVFRIDQETGGLTPAGQPVAVGTPVCVLFLR
jgi:6-phosphogluconolactonase